MEEKAPETKATSHPVDKVEPTEHDIVVGTDRAESSITEQVAQSSNEEDGHGYADFETPNNADAQSDK
jgi:hypothetical protein